MVFAIFLLTIAGVAQAENIIDDFESYADTAELLGTWSERNGNVATITLSTTEAHDGNQSMNYEYSCGKSPYWSEAFTIFPADQDWSMYDTFSMWVKGKLSSQSLENMYVVIYKAKVPNPVDHSELEILGKARFDYVTQKSDWTYWRADIDYDFEPLSSVRALGIGMSPDNYGSGVIQIDSIAVDNTGLGGVIENFEYYADTNDLLADPNFVSHTDNCTLTLEDDPNVFYGDYAIRVDSNHGQYPYMSKVMFNKEGIIRHLGYNWNYYDPILNKMGRSYTSLTVHFRVTNPENSIHVALVDKYFSNVAVYDYNDGAYVPAGDWIRWDIDLHADDPYVAADPTLLEDVERVDFQIRVGDYGQSVVYLDDIYVNVCGIGRYGVGGLGGNIYDDDGHCIVNFKDYAVLAGHWLDTGCASPGYCDGADITEDGTVDIDDAAQMVAEWLGCNLLYDGDCL
jgi:hypothetical protein